MKSPNPDFYLASLESTLFKTPLKCSVLQSFKADSENTLLLVSVDPHFIVPGSIFPDNKKREFGFLVLGPEHSTKKDIPLKNFPIFVKIYTTNQFFSSFPTNLEIDRMIYMSRGEIYPSKIGEDWSAMLEIGPKLTWEKWLKGESKYWNYSDTYIVKHREVQIDFNDGSQILYQNISGETARLYSQKEGRKRKGYKCIKYSNEKFIIPRK